MQEIDREKQERDDQIHLFIQKTLKELLRQPRPTSKRKVRLSEPIGNMMPNDVKHADEVMRIFREEDR